MTAILTVTAKNQVTFPTEMLARLNINKGDKLFFRAEGKSLRIEKVGGGLRDLQGSLSLTSVGKKLDLEEVIKKAEKIEAKRLADEN